MVIIKVIGLSVTAVAVLFLLSKLMGNKQISQLSTFDYIAGITIGNIAGELATGTDINAIENIVAMTVVAGLTLIVAIFTSKSVNVRKVVTGRPLVILDKGQLYRENLKKAHLDVSDFMTMCRLQGYFDLTQIQTAILEHNGGISILPKTINRPATPADMNLSPAQEYIMTSVILDGHVMSKNLKLVGKDEKWLAKKLNEQGFDSAKEIHLALCDTNNNLTAYPIIDKKIEIDWFE